MNLDLHEQLRLVEKSIYNIKIIKNPHIKVQLKVVSIKGFLILYIENPSLKVQLVAVIRGRTCYSIYQKSIIGSSTCSRKAIWNCY